jgi:hypothetical protein
MPELSRHGAQCQPLERGEVLEAGINSDLTTQRYSRLRTSGILVIIGLIIEIISFFWIHPIAFMSFLVFGCGFLGLGILLFLWTLVWEEPKSVKQSVPVA